MSGAGFHVFQTAIGFGGIVWREAGVLGVFLPEREEAVVRRALAKRFEAAVEASPPPAVAEAVERMQALMQGEPADLTGVALDLSRTPEFNQRVYAVARTIPPGQVMTYGEIAVKLGDRLLAQQVGQALGKNPFPIIVPCHRVLAANGKTGGFSAPGGVATKMRLLSIERARTDDAPSLFDDLPLAARPDR